MNKAPDKEPTHPGHLLRDEVFPAMSLSVARAAQHLMVSRQTLHEIVAGRSPITPAMALRIGKLCGNGPGLWLRMQQNHDLWRLQREMASELERIPTIRS